MLIPTGFWSYSSSDDESSRGRLSQLRALLAAELQQQIGRAFKVNIFQDIAAIPPGREWARQIDEAMKSSSFLIPIVTPAFVQSEWCCKEVEMFRRREERLSASGLIFPIHYIDTDHIDPIDLHECHDRDVLEFLGTRQWVDFRRLRFRPPDSEEVALALESLATGIRNELRRPKARSVAPPAPTVAAPRKSSAKARTRATAPEPKEIGDLRHRAERGEAAAQLDLGHRYWNGKGVAKDDRKAVAWYREAAKRGNAEAQHQLGNCYSSGRGVGKDERQAVSWYRKAAEQGYADAQFFLSTCYSTGRGVAKDEHEGVAWLRKAAEQGDRTAQSHLAFAYSNGRGVRQGRARGR